MKCYFDVERLYSIKIIVIVVLAIISGNALERSSACRAGECLQEETTGENSDESDWISLFNGENLDGWTVKIAGHPVGENFANTFRVEDGILKCEYDDYGAFNGQFGHLYSNLAYSHYKLRLQYRFVGRMLPDAPNYVDLNSGVMLHSQSPQSMRLEQGFPASLEMQFLASLLNPPGRPCPPIAGLRWRWRFMAMS